MYDYIRSFSNNKQWLHHYYPSTPVALLPSKLDDKSSHGHIEFGFVFIAPCAPRKFQPKLYPNSKHKLSIQVQP